MDIKKLTNIKGIKDQVQEVASGIQDEAAALAAAGQEKLNAVLDEYQKILPIAESLGLHVGKFNVEMGLLPEIRTSLVGSIDQVSKEGVQEIIAAHPNNKLLASVLNALLLTKELKERLNITNLPGITIDVKLGVPPNISVQLDS